MLGTLHEHLNTFRCSWSGTISGW